DGVRTKETKALLVGLDPGLLPALESVRVRIKEKRKPEREADRATVRDQIAWEDAVAAAAVEKDRREQKRHLAQHETEHALKPADNVELLAFGTNCLSDPTVTEIAATASHNSRDEEGDNPTQTFAANAKDAQFSRVMDLTPEAAHPQFRE